MFKGFQSFLMRGNVVDLAVAVVIGAAFGSVVTSFVSGVITPLIGVFGGIPKFSDFFFTINGSQFQIGAFIDAIISFIVIAAVIYFLVVMPMNRLQALQNRKDEPAKEPETKKCPECVSEIPLEARRCKFCTSVVVPLPATPK